MLKKLPRIITLTVGISKRSQIYLFTSTNRRRYYFSSQDKQQVKSNQDKQEAERLRKIQDIQFRKRKMEDIELKNIRDKIQNTKGSYNPFFAYIKLYSNHFLLAIVFGCLCFVITVFLSVGGVFKDPITNKKKIILISEKFQKSMDPVLKDIMLTQLRGTLTPNDSVSMSLKRKSQQIEGFINKKTSKNYKIIIISSQQHIINILPSSIIISKNIFTLPQCEFEDLKKFLLTMQVLFSKKLHIKELAFQNILIFAIAKLKRSTKIDIKLTSVYSRRYNKSQVDLAVNIIALRLSRSACFIKSLYSLTKRALRWFLKHQPTKFTNKSLDFLFLIDLKFLKSKKSRKYDSIDQQNQKQVIIAETEYSVSISATRISQAINEYLSLQQGL